MIVGNHQPEQFEAGFDFQSNSRRLPKVIRIVVHKGQGLSYRVPGSVENEKTMHWRLIFHGGVKKLASEAIESTNGNPEWNCEVTINTKNPSDPVIILVEDKKRRPVGQVMLNLQDIPCRPLPELYVTNLEKAKLNATKKNSYPSGSIFYWIGTDEYWDADAVANASLYKSVSLRKSLSSIGSAIFKIGRKDKDDSKSTMSGMSRMKKLREKTRNKTQGSFLGHSEMNLSRSNTGASNNQLSRNSSVTSLSKHGGGWSTNGSVLQTQDGRSYNPVVDSDSDVDQQSSSFPANQNNQTAKLKASTSAINLEQSATASPADKTGFLKKMKSKLNRSTQNLSQTASSTLKPPKPAKDQRSFGFASKRNSKSSVFEDVPVHSRQGSECGNPFGISDTEDSQEPATHHMEMEKTTLKQPTPAMNELRKTPLMGQHEVTEPFTIRAGVSQTPKLNNGPNTHSRGLSGGSDLFQMMNGGDSQSPPLDTQWGLHPEERTQAGNKSIHTMSRQELVAHINSLENANARLNNTIRQVTADKDKFQRELESTSRELTTVRGQLSDLRLRLLRDNQSQYLEVGPGGEEETSESKEANSLSLGVKQNGHGMQASNPLRALANSKNEDTFNWWG